MISSTIIEAIRHIKGGDMWYHQSYTLESITSSNLKTVLTYKEDTTGHLMILKCNRFKLEYEVKDFSMPMIGQIRNYD